MKYKELVLARYPNAKTAITSLWPDGTPRHYTVLAGNERLEIPVKSETEWWNDNLIRNAAAAWKEAYLWCLANGKAVVQRDLFDEQQRLR